MKRNELPALKTVTDAMFRREYQKLRPLLEAEARVQHQLARLDVQVTQIRRDSTQTDGYRVTGTDVLWNGWEASTRRQLNMELARCRAQKLAALGALRKAFGRQQAVKALTDAANIHNRQKAARKNMPQ